MNAKERIIVIAWVAWAILFSHAAAQTPESRPATPRLLIEQGIHQENDDHDLERALESYRRARTLAESKKDETAATFATACEKRVLARLGRSTEQDAAAEKAGSDMAIWNLLGRLARATGDEIKAAQGDLALYGNAALPRLDGALTSGFTGADPTGLVPPTAIDKRRVAEVIGAIRTAEAAASLARHIESPDPVEQTAAAKALSANVPSHVAVLKKALVHPESAVRRIAAEALTFLDDPTLEKDMMRLSSDGIEPAIRWISAFAPRRASEIIARTDLPASVRLEMIDRVRRAVPVTVESITTLLQLTKEADATLNRRAVMLMDDLIRQSASAAGPSRRTDPDDRRNPNAPTLPPELQAAIEARLLEMLERTPNDNSLANYAHSAAVRVGSIATFLYAARITADPKRGFVSNSSFSDDILPRLKPEDFESMVSAMAEREAKRASDGSDQEGRLFADIFNNYARRVPIEASRWVKAFESLADSKFRQRFAEIAVDVLAKRLIFRNTRAEPAELDAARPLLPILDWLVNLRSRNPRTEMALRLMTRIPDKTSLPAAFGAMSRANLSKNSEGNPVDPEDNGPDAFRQLAEIYPDDAAALYAGALERAEKGQNDWDASMALQRVFCLPETYAIATFKTLYAAAKSDGAKSDLLMGLVNNSGGAVTTALIVDYYKDIRQAQVRATALKRFARELTVSAIPVLGEALRDPDDSVREAARTAFAEFKKHREAIEEFEAWSRSDRANQKTTDELLELLKSANDTVKIGAIAALAGMRRQDVLPALAKALDGASEPVRAALLDAIAKISAK